MWTHLQPHLRDTLTSPSIAKHARVALYRSLNMRRLVAMTASGSTMSFGMPSWDALVGLMIDATNVQLARADGLGDATRAQIAETRHLVWPLIRQVEHLMGMDEARPERTMEIRRPERPREDAQDNTVMDLCEAILRELPNDLDSGRSALFLARWQVAQHFRSRNVDLVARRIAKLMPKTEFVPEGERLEVSEDVLAKLGETNLPGRESDATLYRRLLIGIVDGSLTPDQPLFHQSGKDQSERPGTATRTFGPILPGTDDRNVVRALLQDLRLGRVVTLNYDVQLEREILERLGSAAGADTDGFVDLCEDRETVRPHVKRLVMDNAVEKGAASITVSPETMGDIVNFASYSRRYRHQILHLHGRFDDPENMVLTKADYDRIYMREETPRQIFREAQEMLFGGNDVLLVGNGMTEEDVLRPFRRFMARHDAEREGSRRIFVLFASESCAACPVNGDCDTCKRKDEARTLDHKIRFDVHTIVFGGPRFRFIRGRLGAAVSALKKIDGTAKDETVVKVMLDPFREKVSRFLKDLKEGETGDAEGLLHVDEHNLLSEIAEAMAPMTSVQRTACIALLEDIRGSVQARGLVRELAALNAEKGHWWDAWRLPPYERRALYHLSIPDEAAGPSARPADLWVRHCPSDAVAQDRHDEEADAGLTAEQILARNWPILEKIRAHVERRFRDGNPDKITIPHTKFADQSGYILNRMKTRLGRRDDRTRPRKGRILRLTAPRGGGKGTLIRLMMRADVRAYVFSGAGSGPAPDYAGAFMVHQSFSMEFSSIAKALTRFYARHCAEFLLRERAPADLRREAQVAILAIKSSLHGCSGAVPETERKAAIAQVLRELGTADLRVLGDPCRKATVEKMYRKEPLDPAEIDAVARRLYVARREAEPRLVPKPALESAGKLHHDVERPHRLEVLREVMVTLERAMAGQEQRLFVCLSGLDRICDRNGDARNPMHRAMFRLLCGKTENPYVADPDPMVDYLFMAGRPEIPITFLSEEYNRAERLPTAEEKYYSRESRTGRILRKWHELAPFGWEERVRVVATDARDERLPDSKLFEPFEVWVNTKDASRQDNRTDEIHSTREIQRGLWKNMSLTLMVLRAWQRNARWPVIKERLSFRAFIEALDRTFARDGRAGVITAVLTLHERLDRAGAARSAAGSERDHSFETCVERRRGNDPFDFELMRLLLRQLALFGLPVEIWVLIGCPLIQRQLEQHDSEPKRPIPKTGKTDEERAATIRADFARRARHLELLSRHLKALCERSLTIEIEASQNSREGRLDRDDPQRKLHVRYALHARLREFIAYQMQFTVTDEGELNHHQISVFCDQPRDLPTPRRQHFDLTRSLMTHMIEESRISLDTLYRSSWSGERYRRTKWDPSRAEEDTSPKVQREIETAALRLFAPRGDGIGATSIAGSLGETHAIPQRLRACFSLLRGTLSVGSLSRLDVDPEVSGGEPPFEVYRSWLRGLLNAAAGLERNREELTLLLEGTLFGEVGDGVRELGLGALHESIEGMSEDSAEDRENKARMRTRLERVRHRMTAIRARAISLEMPDVQRTSYVRLRHPFYRDEIAWLYNERGLASFMQGRLFDAIPLFNQAKFIMAHTKTPPFDSKAYHAAERRINLNLSLAYIDRGKVEEARGMLEELERSMRSVRRSTPSKVHLFARSYLALCDHLGGSFERAIEEYNRCLRRFIENRDLRAISIFNRHLGELHMRMEETELAQRHIQLAVNSASQAEQRDVENHALAALAKLEVRQGHLAQAQGRISRVQHYARTMGLYRLQTDVLQADAELKLTRGELGLAGEAASRAVAMSARYGLRLRKLSSLVLYGRIQKERGELDLARDVLEEAKREAERLGYQIQAALAADMLAQIGTIGR